MKLCRVVFKREEVVQEMTCRKGSVDHQECRKSINVEGRSGQCPPSYVKTAQREPDRPPGGLVVGEIHYISTL